MASLRNEAKWALDAGRYGIGWIACARVGRGWRCEVVYPEVDQQGFIESMDDSDTAICRELLALDPQAILVNSYWHNLGDTESMTAQDLAVALRWQYQMQNYMVADAIA